MKSLLALALCLCASALAPDKGRTRLDVIKGLGAVGPRVAGASARGQRPRGAPASGVEAYGFDYVSEPVAASVARSVDKETSRKILQIERLNIDSNGSGDKAKHLPTILVNGDKVEVSVAHVMDAAKPHFIEYIWLKDEDTDTILAAKRFDANDASPPTLFAKARPGSTVTGYAYCNIHGLWIGNSEQV
ncbi:hypothetical protein M885DRAFT_614506 [Pelagophyceae sp. CCMP2097]|nr:hypothetical protein M885DRAFT_614506 [Pelagophyceae sp. CCMP2097]